MFQKFLAFKFFAHYTGMNSLSLIILFILLKYKVS